MLRLGLPKCPKWEVLCKMYVGCEGVAILGLVLGKS